MRNLTSQQKKFLRKLIREQDITSADDMSPESWDKLVEMNDSEVLWQNANSFISDERFKELDK